MEHISSFNTLDDKKRTLPWKITYGSAYTLIGLNGLLWFSSIDGFYRVDYKKLNFQQILNSDNGIYYSIAYDYKNNRLVLGGEDCFATIDLGVFNKVNYRKSVYITAITEDSVVVPMGSSSTRSVKINQNNNVTMELSTYSYFGTENRFFYRWNKDGKWTLLEDNFNKINFPTMPFGTHTLYLSATNPNLDKNAVITEYQIQVPFPWYLSIYAISVYIICSISIIILIILRQKRKSLMKYQQKEREKTLELSEMKMDFFVNMSHELKTPLSLVIAPLGKLISENPSPKIKSTLLNIQNNALKISKLVNKILNANQESWESENSLLRTHVELIALVERNIDSFKTVAENREVSIYFIHNKNEIWADLDYIKINSIITNLMSNALKHVKDKTGIVKVSVTDSSDKIKIIVEDNGSEIPKSEQSMVFMKYFHGKNEDKNNHGTGIGLYLVKKFTEMHGGNVQIESHQGAKFIINIPTSSLQDWNSENTSHKNNDYEKKDTLLIIDDNKEMVEFLVSSLQDKYNIVEAYDGTEGIRCLNEKWPSLIIVDQMMPMMNGMEFVKTVKKNLQTSDIPIIMLTAKSDFKTEEKSIRTGVDVFLAKPFDLKKLQLQIARLLKQRENERRKLSLQNIVEDDNVKRQNHISPDELFMQKVIKAIDENIEKENFNVSTLAEVLNVDKKQLYRKIKQLTGKTPVVFLRQTRLRKAAYLLESREYSVSEVMYMIGMTNVSYFAKCFRDEFKMSPKEYQDAKQND